MRRVDAGDGTIRSGGLRSAGLGLLLGPEGELLLMGAWRLEGRPLLRETGSAAAAARRTLLIIAVSVSPKP